MKHSIIPLFIPHYGCPHQCVFCNQVRITGASTPVRPEDVAGIIRQYLDSAREPRDWEAAFYGGSFTALPIDVMEALLQPAAEALREGRIGGIRLSTRPDCISMGILALLKRMGVTTVELGVQSLDPKVLLLAERGHTVDDTKQAVRLLKEAGFSVGLQFMVGLPGEDGGSLRRTARAGAALRPDFIRMYPVLVLRDTKLCRMYERGAYEPLSVREAAFRCAFLKRWYGAHGIPVIRTGLQATEELDRGDALAAGPYHAAMGELTDQVIARHVLHHALRHLHGDRLTITCHPRDRSKFTGYRGETKKWLETKFTSVIYKEDPTLQVGHAVAAAGEDIVSLKM